MPGLVIGHSHLYSSFLAGVNYSIKPNSFKELLEQLFWKLDGALDLEATYHSGKTQAIKHIKNGVTTFVDHHASGENIIGSLNQLKKSICDESGMRGIFAFETSDRFNIAECIHENISFIENNQSEHCAGMFGMHASLSLSDETLKSVSKKLGNHPIHIHIAESLEEQQESIKLYGKRVVERFDEYELLNENSILAHCLHIDEKEAEIIAKRRCLVATNPTSNLNTSNGILNHKILDKYNIKTIIGNDSLGSNITREFQNLFYAMHFKDGNINDFTYEDLRNYINNLYDFVGEKLNISIGKIKPGYVADFISLPYDVQVPISNKNIMSFMVESVFNSFHPQYVWCSGDLKLDNYKTIWDEEKIFFEAKNCAEKIWRKTGGI